MSTVVFSSQSDCDRVARACFNSRDPEKRASIARAAREGGYLLGLSWLEDVEADREQNALVTFSDSAGKPGYGKPRLTREVAFALATSWEGKKALGQLGLKATEDAPYSEADRIRADNILLSSPEGREKLRRRGVDVNAILSRRESKRM
ncbi:MAG: hypothetical protein ACYC1I_11745 [Acidimicrobiales bacterium]